MYAMKDLFPSVSGCAPLDTCGISQMNVSRQKRRVEIKTESKERISHDSGVLQQRLL